MDGDILKEKNPELYRIAHEGGTEPEFSGKYVHTTDAGMYHCAVCGAALFSSEAKFDSGTGWPSFTDPVAQQAIVFEDDDEYGIHRTEVKCAACDAHLGHVFHDGPKQNEKTCNRYCINSISLELKTKTNPRRTQSSEADYANPLGDTHGSKTSEPGSFFQKIKDWFDGDGDSGGDGGGDGD